MAGVSTQTMQHVIRAQVWEDQLKDFFESELLGANRYVDWIDVPGGSTLINIPSLGQMQIQDYEEGQAIRYTGIATGNWTFIPSEYKSAATYITDKFKQDSYIAAQIEAAFVPKMRRALAVEMETAALAVGNQGQVAGDPNSINGVPHRLVASGTGGVLTATDFLRAKYALDKANVPFANRVAIVDPSVELNLSAMPNLVNLSNNKSWEGIVRDGMTSGMRFVVNVYGFDVYMSNHLPQGITETISGDTVTGDGVANYFFAAGGGDVLPFKGAVVQAPRVESERNKDLQRDEYVMTARYGFGLYRPENLVVILSDQGAPYEALSA